MPVGTAMADADSPAQDPPPDDLTGYLPSTGTLTPAQMNSPKKPRLGISLAAVLVDATDPVALVCGYDEGDPLRAGAMEWLIELLPYFTIVFYPDAPVPGQAATAVLKHLTWWFRARALAYFEEHTHPEPLAAAMRMLELVSFMPYRPAADVVIERGVLLLAENEPYPAAVVLLDVVKQNDRRTGTAG
jgi:hypothetical protein